jgi:hypothetical protein
MPSFESIREGNAFKVSYDHLIYGIWFQFFEQTTNIFILKPTIRIICLDEPLSVSENALLS